MKDSRISFRLFLAYSNRSSNTDTNRDTEATRFPVLPQTLVLGPFCGGTPQSLVPCPLCGGYPSLWSLVPSGVTQVSGPMSLPGGFPVSGPMSLPGEYPSLWSHSLLGLPQDRGNSPGLRYPWLGLGYSPPQPGMGYPLRGRLPRAVSRRRTFLLPSVYWKPVFVLCSSEVLRQTNRVYPCHPSS